MVSISPKIQYWLVVELATPVKNDGVRQIGSSSQLLGKIKAMFQTTKQNILMLFNIAMENGPFIVDFPIETSIYEGFSMAMLNNQMVDAQTISTINPAGFVAKSSELEDNWCVKTPATSVKQCGSTRSHPIAQAINLAEA